MSLDGFFAVSQTTDSIQVHVQPHYDAEQSLPEQQHYVWHYHIRIENHGVETVQLLDRHWVIIDGHGVMQEVRGDGVVGEQPVLVPGGSFDYVSGCPLSTSSGTMHGSYGMQSADGRQFRVDIPAFDLLSPDSRRMAN